ncbi:MAG: carotenoid biosynthesis protein [Acidovorax sp.]|nr:carotenoid biosynthesis protein [Acidovorax sp.]
MSAPPFLAERLPALGFALLAAFLIATAVRTHTDTTIAIIIASVLMFACCWASATHLLGTRPALQFVLIAVSFGWFAEQMGSTHGWFFGHYTYTDVLGPRFVGVPIVIPMMWFSLAYAGYVISNLIVWQSPVDGAPGLGNAAMLSFLAAMIVTAFDLGADPYLVYTLKAWIMAKTDGAWFGETVQGFFGWVFVAFVIIFGFRMSVRKMALQPLSPFLRRHALVPLCIYASGMVFQMILGNPVEIRSIAPFAMGIPLLCALAGFQRWSAPAKANA